MTLSNLPLTNPFPALQNIDGIEMQIQSEVPFTISQSEFHINSQIEFGFMGERDCIKISNVSGKLFIDNYTQSFSVTLVDERHGIKGWILHINILVRPYCVAEK